MATNSELISKLRNDNKFMSVDQKISDRYLISKCYDTARTLIKQEKNILKLFRADEMFQPIDCLKMKQVDLSSCINVQSDIKISRSIDKLPSEIEVGTNGYLIQRIYTHQNGEFDKTTSREFEVVRKLKFNNNRYYWIQDNYLYVNLPNIECLTIRAYFKQDISSFTGCQEPYDRKFYCPEYLIGPLIEKLNNEFRLLHQYKTDTDSQNIDTSK